MDNSAFWEDIISRSLSHFFFFFFFLIFDSIHWELRYWTAQFMKQSYGWPMRKLSLVFILLCFPSTSITSSGTHPNVFDILFCVYAFFVLLGLESRLGLGLEFKFHNKYSIMELIFLNYLNQKVEFTIYLLLCYYLAFNC